MMHYGASDVEWLSLDLLLVLIFLSLNWLDDHFYSIVLVEVGRIQQRSLLRQRQLNASFFLEIQQFKESLSLCVCVLCMVYRATCIDTYAK